MKWRRKKTQHASTSPKWTATQERPWKTVVREDPPKGRTSGDVYGGPRCKKKTGLWDGSSAVRGQWLTDWPDSQRLGRSRISSRRNTQQMASIPCRGRAHNLLWVSVSFFPRCPNTCSLSLVQSGHGSKMDTLVWPFLHWGCSAYSHC